MSRGGGKGPGPPLEIEKQKKKKKKKKVIRANLKLFHLYFATFLVENITFSVIFWAGPPPLKNWKAKKKKKKGFQILGPPSYEFLDTRLVPVDILPERCLFPVCRQICENTVNPQSRLSSVIRTAWQRKRDVYCFPIHQKLYPPCLNIDFYPW